MRVRTATLPRMLLAALLFQASASAADEWDVGTDTDNSKATDNELFHGAQQVHDLARLGVVVGLADQDWYLVRSRALSSYQFVIEGQTGALDLGPVNVQLLAADGTTVLRNAEVLEPGGNPSLSWFNASEVPVATYVRVQGAACGPFCGDQDRYRVRFYDTTYTIPRFNNTGSQTTVLLVQNVADQTCEGEIHLIDAQGASIAFQPWVLAARQLLVLPTTGRKVENQSGSVRVDHTCGYGGLSGKAVSIESATGFAFDTPLVQRPR